MIKKFVQLEEDEGKLQSIKCPKAFAFFELLAQY